MAAEPKIKSTEIKPRAASDDVRGLPVDAEATSSALQALLDEKILADDPAAAEAKRVADEATAKQRQIDEAAKAGQTPEQIEAQRLADEQRARDQKKSDDNPPTLADTVKAEEDERAEKQRLADEKAAADAAKAGQTPPADDTAPKPDIFDSVALPTNAKSATTQSFNSLKELARKTATELQTQLDTVKKSAEEAAAKLKAAEEAAATRSEASPELLAELEDLRKFRISKDAESDPEFSKFNTEIAKNDERIYKKLADGNISEASIAKIKELGGLSAVDQGPILDALPVHIRRTVEAILVDSEGLKDKQADALAAAKAKGSEYATERAAREATVVSEAANGLLKDLPWTAEKPIPASATPEQKAEIEAANGFARESIGTLKQLLTDRSPARFAELAVCTILAGKHRADKIALQAKLASFETAKAAELKELTDKLTAATTAKEAAEAKLLKIKQSALPRSAGEGHKITTTSQKVGIFDERSPMEALEQLRLEQEAAQNA